MPSEGMPVRSMQRGFASVQVKNTLGGLNTAYRGKQDTAGFANSLSPARSVLEVHQ